MTNCTLLSHCFLNYVLSVDTPPIAVAATLPPLACRYITAAELASASSYMRGRLTADRINAAIDEMAVLAEANVAMVAAARRNRAVGPDKKQAMWLLVNIAVSGRAG